MSRLWDVSPYENPNHQDWAPRIGRVFSPDGTVRILYADGCLSIAWWSK